MSLFMEILFGCLLALIVLFIERFYDFYFGSKLEKSKDKTKEYNTKMKIVLSEFMESIKRQNLHHDNDILLIEDVLNKKCIN